MLVELLWWWCWWIMHVCVHICCWWISYMSLVLIWWCKHVLKYVGVDCWSCVNICIVVVESYVHASITCCWRILCIQLFGVIMMCLLHHGVTTSEVIWYHMHTGVVSRRIAWIRHKSWLLMCLVLFMYLLSICDWWIVHLLKYVGDNLVDIKIMWW